MRPPDLPGGNPLRERQGGRADVLASMRPPDLPGGNAEPSYPGTNSPESCFNEAAGFTRRKLASLTP